MIGSEYTPVVGSENADFHVKNSQVTLRWPMRGSESVEKVGWRGATAWVATVIPAVRAIGIRPITDDRERKRGKTGRWKGAKSEPLLLGFLTIAEPKKASHHP